MSISGLFFDMGNQKNDNLSCFMLNVLCLLSMGF